MSVAALFCKARRSEFKHPIARFVTSINFSFFVKFISRPSLCLLSTLRNRAWLQSTKKSRKILNCILVMMVIALISNYSNSTVIYSIRTKTAVFFELINLFQVLRTSL